MVQTRNDAVVAEKAVVQNRLDAVNLVLGEDTAALAGYIAGFEESGANAAPAAITTTSSQSGREKLAVAPPCRLYAELVTLASLGAEYIHIHHVCAHSLWTVNLDGQPH